MSLKNGTILAYFSLWSVTNPNLNQERFDFPAEEEAILNFWKEIDAFRTSVELNKGKPRFSFYDGPPFATGLPHYGHLLAGTIKVSIRCNLIACRIL